MAALLPKPTEGKLWERFTTEEEYQFVKPPQRLRPGLLMLGVFDDPVSVEGSLYIYPGIFGF